MSEIWEELEKARADLLDLGLRNTLLNHKKLKSKGVEIVDENPDQVFQLLVKEERPMSFLAAPEELIEGEVRRVNQDVLTEWLETHDGPNEGDDERETPNRHQDTKLQTPYSPATLERRLLNSFYTARSTIEEQGVNTLYLALGVLEWYESSSSDQLRSAPLILVPVTLHRTSVRAKFRIGYTGEELGDNLSLQKKLKSEFGVELPVLPDTEDLSPVRYFLDVEESLEEQPRWRIDRGAIHLGFFWFTKLLMYEDLDPEHWRHEAKAGDFFVLRALLGNGFSEQESRFPEDVSLDEQINPADLYQIRDADSSQTRAILDVQSGRNLVIQGPPGTGKSQTISNLIAESVACGKRVLFVAEKMAALDVVKRRLDEDGIGDACLELHSHRTNKQTVLEELERTLKLGKPRVPDAENLEDLTAYRDRLNAYVQAVNTPICNSGITPHVAYGEALAATERMEGEGRPTLKNRGGWEEWTGSEFRERKRQISDLERHVQTIGVPDEHPFWSSLLKTYLPRDRQHLLGLCEKLINTLHEARTSCRELADLLGLQDPSSLPEARRLFAAAEVRARMPEIAGMAVEDKAWSEQAARIEELISQGLRYRAVHSEFDSKLVPEAWARDVLELRASVAQFGERWWRLLASDYRKAMRELRQFSQEPIPKTFDEKIAVIDAIRESQQVERRFQEEESFLSHLFGAHWLAGDSDWEHLREAYEWLHEVHRGLETRQLPSNFLSSATVPLDGADLDRQRVQSEGHLDQLEELVREAEELLQLRRENSWLREHNGISVSFDVLDQCLTSWLKEPNSVQDIVHFNNLVAELRESGLGELADLAAHWPHASRHLVDLLTIEWHEVLLEHALSERQELARFEGKSHQEVLASFCSLDRKCIEANRARVALAHWDQLPAPNGGGEVALLRHQMNLKRRHKPIRQLMAEAGSAIQKLKPVFMMSPLSVASYIPPGAVEFDLVIFDEASQIRPVDAFGAILRGRQAVVVGDSKQLPPTPFFEKVVEDPEADEDERSVTEDLESILGLFVSQGVPERMLRWHYRSRHESLIAVSNREFYEEKLFIFPSPDHAKEELGVVLRYHPETVYEPGAKRSNSKEAELVADAVMEHAAKRPDRTLGVAAFSQSQAQVIQDHIELRRRQNSELDFFFNSDSNEPFFVKNLENVQGDERDIILISVGYGKQENGTLWMNFGPLNQEGGERRLNVLITRARLRCEIFSNFKAQDLRPSQSRGVVALKHYLQFAESGQLDLPEPSDREPDSVFEEMVAEKVRGLGYEVHLQVGSAGFFIDLAVVDQDRPGRYLLGIECDGRAYHSASWARDRDRLRQEVLEDRGWSLHRIWSTDWFRHPERELRKVAEKLEGAKARCGRHECKETAHSSDDPQRGSFEVERCTDHDRSLRSKPYRCADISALGQDLTGQELHTCSPQRLAGWVSRVVEVEGPVHESEVVYRIIDAAGYQRAGSRLQATVGAAIDAAIKRGDIRREGKFLWLAGNRQPKPRDRSDQRQAARSIDLIAPEEIDAAVIAVVEAALAIDVDDAAVEVARLFGFARTTTSIRAPIDRSISRLLTQDLLRASDGQIRLTRDRD